MAVKKAKQRAEGSSPGRPHPIPGDQLDLPASYDAEGKRLVPLRDVLSPSVPTMSLTKLSPEQRAAVVVARIKAQPKFEIAMIGAGKIDKERAIAEVQNQTRVGRVLMEIEQRLLNDLVARGRQTAKSNRGE